MAGFGRFKLTDALPEQPEPVQDSQTGGPGQGSAPVRKGKGKGRAKSGGKSAAAPSGGEQQSTTNRSRAK
jgi:hypothetical protein